ncbi:short-chain dehydrogenase [Brevibacillus parabrevis]|uniref:short-chain dehydrogenase n=1 Tax=Brevibacillus parabrevis TaxID=54914 RepID=UPI0007AC1701|nr:short-chain dehydrogenase [Brevibacillus parabrevis]KZE46880.1 short-chain dehydrogenase [Brevibacillus parabrevis]
MAQEALVIGASGMLTEVARWLAKEGYQVTVVGRDRQKLARVRDGTGNPGAFQLLALDYGHTEALRTAMTELVARRGAIDLVVSWIHTTAQEALPVIMTELSRSERPFELYHVCGSRAWKTPPVVHVPATCAYRRVILGFVCEDEQSRWLTNREIADGVIQAIRQKAAQAIVGQVEPWERRPSY